MVATVLANNMQPCWAQHVASICIKTTTMLALVAYSLKQVKLFGPWKQTQHCWPKPPTTLNNVVTCCIHLHGALEMLIIVKFLPSPSIEGVNVPGFNKLVRSRRFEKCKIKIFFWGGGTDAPGPLPCSLSKQTRSLENHKLESSAVHFPA